MTERDAKRAVPGEINQWRTPDPLRSALQAIAEKWRADAAVKDSFHATMGIGWKVCADELAAALLLGGSPLDQAIDHVVREFHEWHLSPEIALSDELLDALSTLYELRYPVSAAALPTKETGSCANESVTQPSPNPSALPETEL